MNGEKIKDKKEIKDKVLLVLDPGERNRLRNALRVIGYSHIWGFSNPLKALNGLKAHYYEPRLVFTSKSLYNYTSAVLAENLTRKFTVIAIDEKKPLPEGEELEGIIGNYQ